MIFTRTYKLARHPTSSKPGIAYYCLLPIASPIASIHGPLAPIRPCRPGLGGWGGGWGSPPAPPSPPPKAEPSSPIGLPKFYIIIRSCQYNILPFAASRRWCVLSSRRVRPQIQCYNTTILLYYNMIILIYHYNIFILLDDRILIIYDILYL